jgi:TetR/AcrR family transcriptional repressor of mexCD-oprJ operon
MAEPRLTERQQATADRNVAAILDATEELLARRGQAGISAVAKHSGVSRVTVYAHFPTSEALLEAAVERAVGQTMSALQAANSDEGPPVEALERLLAGAWRHLARYSAMAQAVAERMTPETVARTHQAAYHTLGALLERGRAAGSFRSDLPVSWLVTTCIAVIHACAAEVREGRIEERDAVRILTTTVRDLFTGGGQVTGSGQVPGGKA